MGNKSGSNRFTKIESDIRLLVEVIEAKVLTGADEWELVRNEYLKRQAEMPREDFNVEVVGRDIKSLKSLDVRFTDAKSRAGNYNYFYNH